MTVYPAVRRGTIGSRTTRLGVAALLAGALLLTGCQSPDTERHGAGEKLTESSDRSDGTDGSSGVGDPANDGELAGQSLPDLELSWLRPPDPRDSDLPPATGDAGDADTAKDSVRLPELAGEPLVINVWAVWCTPCRDEIPHLQRLSEQAGDRLRVIGVDYDDDPDAATALLDELGVDYPQLADPAAELRAPLRLGLGIPVTLYVAPDGEVAHVARTPYRSLGQLRSDVERYLDVTL